MSTHYKQGREAFKTAQRPGCNPEGIFLARVAALSTDAAAEFERGWQDAADELEDEGGGMP